MGRAPMRMQCQIATDALQEGVVGMGTGATLPGAVAAVLPDFQLRLLLPPCWPPLPQDYHHLLEARRSSKALHHPMVVSSALPQGRIDQQSLNPSGSHWDLDWWRMLEMRNLKNF